MTASLPGDLAGEQAFLDSVEGEIAFFRSIMRTRPIGLHRHFHLLAVRNGIHKDTGKSLHIESLWDKLRTFYDLDALEAIVSRAVLQSSSVRVSHVWGTHFIP